MNKILFHNFHGKNYSSCLIFLFLTLFTIATLSKSESKATDNKDRFRTCNPAGGEGAAGQTVEVEGLKNLSMTSEETDAELETDNPVCAGILLGSYIGVKVGIANMNRVCGSGSKIPRATPSLIMDAKDLAVGTYKGISSAISGNNQCLVAVSAASSSFAILTAEMEIIYAIANDVYKKAHICGSNWKRWNSKTMNRDIPDRLQQVENWVEEAKDKKNNPSKNALLDVTLENGSKEFREWVYGGVEKEDIGGCVDVTRRVDGKYPPQRYYLRGSEPGNFNCNKYKINKEANDPITGGKMTADRVKEYEAAYKCCTNRSRNSICIENGNDYKFCEAGSRCWVGPIEFEASFKIADRLICANTYSLCPFNFNIDGGTTECNNYRDGIDKNGVFEPIKYEDIKSGNCLGKSEIRDNDCKPNNKAGKCKNYCQMFNHCVAVSPVNFYESSISSPYFSSACLDFEGDSRNNLEYGMSLVSGSFRMNQRNFTAPIAQCVRETMENIFYNRAGHSICLMPYEVPDHEGRCNSDSYHYKKGEDVSKYLPEYKSIFNQIQDRIKDVVKVVLTLVITLMGFKILLGSQELKRSEIIIFLFKMAVVVYFATGNAWQNYFFDGIYKASDTVSNAVINLGTNSDETKRDGCQFGQIKVTEDNGATKIINAPTYPAGKSYLAIWDTLDCKIARYLGYGPELDVANIAILIFAGFFTGPIGIYFSLLLMVFGFFMISSAIRALHVFLLSSMSIILMIFLSPIIIPCILFNRTASIFNAWLSNLIGFILQPIILFAYIGVFVLIIDNIVIGSASFTGSPPNKMIICNKYCLDKRTGSLIEIASDKIDQECRVDMGRKIMNPNQDSVGCILNFKNTQNFPGFEVIGISLTLLGDIFSEGGRQKLITLAKGALVLYILDKFMNQIPAIASNLVGGSNLGPDSMSARNIIGKVGGIASAIQKRANRGLKKFGKAAGNKAKDSARNIGQSKKEDKESPEKSESDNNTEIGASDEITSDNK